MNPDRPIAAPAALALGLIAGTLGACAGGPGARGGAAPDDSPVSITITPPDGAEPEPAGVAAAEPDPGAPPDAAPESAPGLTIRDDGRPSWWFAGVVREPGRVRICAESLGRDMGGTRRAALDAGRARLRAALGIPEGAPIAGERVERTLIWPLPNQSAGENRYAGYVLLSGAVAPG